MVCSTGPKYHRLHKVQYATSLYAHKFSLHRVSYHATSWQSCQLTRVGDHSAIHRDGVLSACMECVAYRRSMNACLGDCIPHFARHRCFSYGTACEERIRRRSRNKALGVPLHPADFVYVRYCLVFRWHLPVDPHLKGSVSCRLVICGC